jgi:hypothetical protein
MCSAPQPVAQGKWRGKKSMTTYEQELTLRRPASLTIDEFNMLDAEHIASLPTREDRNAAPLIGPLQQGK